MLTSLNLVFIAVQPKNDYATFVVSSLQNSSGINIFNMFSNYQLLERSGNNTLTEIDVRIRERGNN